MLVLAGFHRTLAAEPMEQNQSKTIVVQWNEVFLEAVRHAYLGPPMVARALAVAHTCIYDAWAAYDSKAIGTERSGQLRRPEIERTTTNKTIAISYAAYHAARELFPASKADLDQFMSSLGYDPENSTMDVHTPAGLGNAACEAVLAVRRKDGSNQLGDMTPSGRPYADYTAYKPVNEAGSVLDDVPAVKDPDRFQPQYYRDPSVRAFYPYFVGAQWYRVSSFAGPYEKDFASVLAQFPLAKYGSKEYKAQAEELLTLSAALNDEQKMIAEYWSDGPHSELPPGHWCLFAEFVSIRDHHNLDDDAKFFFVLTDALMDAGIAAWQGKRLVDSVRPITAVHYLFHDQTVRAWGGPGNGTASVKGAAWRPYQPDFLPTPPFPEYPSGHSTFSAAGARILQLWSGSDDFGDKVVCKAKSSRVETGITPSNDVVLTWPTFTFAADQAGMSRRYGGIHFKSGDLAGRALGRRVAEKVWAKAQHYIDPDNARPTHSKK